MRGIIGGIAIFAIVVLYAVCANAGRISREEEQKELELYKRKQNN